MRRMLTVLTMSLIMVLGAIPALANERKHHDPGAGDGNPVVTPYENLAATYQSFDNDDAPALLLGKEEAEFAWDAEGPNPITFVREGDTLTATAGGAAEAEAAVAAEDAEDAENGDGEENGGDGDEHGDGGAGVASVSTEVGGIDAPINGLMVEFANVADGVVLTLDDIRVAAGEADGTTEEETAQEPAPEEQAPEDQTPAGETPDNGDAPAEAPDGNADPAALVEDDPQVEGDTPAEEGAPGETDDETVETPSEDEVVGSINSDDDPMKLFGWESESTDFAFSANVVLDAAVEATEDAETAAALEAAAFGDSAIMITPVHVPGEGEECQTDADAQEIRAAERELLEAERDYHRTGLKVVKAKWRLLDAHDDLDEATEDGADRLWRYHKAVWKAQHRVDALTAKFEAAAEAVAAAQQALDDVRCPQGPDGQDGDAGDDAPDDGDTGDESGSANGDAGDGADDGDTGEEATPEQ